MKDEIHGRIGSRVLNMGIRAESEVETLFRAKLMCDSDTFRSPIQSWGHCLDRLTEHQHHLPLKEA